MLTFYRLVDEAGSQRWVREVEVGLRRDGVAQQLGQGRTGPPPGRLGLPARREAVLQRVRCSTRRAGQGVGLPNGVQPLARRHQVVDRQESRVADVLGDDGQIDVLPDARPVVVRELDLDQRLRRT